MTIPWEAMDAEHPDHDDWVAQAGRCFASHRHPTDTRCCDYRDHSPEPCACPEHPESYLHPLGTKPWPEA